MTLHCHSPTYHAAVTWIRGLAPENRSPMTVERIRNNVRAVSPAEAEAAMQECRL